MKSSKACVRSAVGRLRFRAQASACLFQSLVVLSVGFANAVVMLAADGGGSQLSGASRRAASPRVARRIAAAQGSPPLHARDARLGQHREGHDRDLPEVDLDQPADAGLRGRSVRARSGSRSRGRRGRRRASAHSTSRARATSVVSRPLTKSPRRVLADLQPHADRLGRVVLEEQLDAGRRRAARARRGRRRASPCRGRDRPCRRGSHSRRRCRPPRPRQVGAGEFGFGRCALEDRHFRWTLASVDRCVVPGAVQREAVRRRPGIPRKKSSSVAHPDRGSGSPLRSGRDDSESRPSPPPPAPAPATARAGACAPAARRSRGRSRDGPGSPA